MQFLSLEKRGSLQQFMFLRDAWQHRLLGLCQQADILGAFDQLPPEGRRSGCARTACFFTPSKYDGKEFCLTFRSQGGNFGLQS